MPRSRSRPGKGRRGGPWYGEFKRRIAFERGASRAFPGMKTSIHRSAGYSATVMVYVPGYERRELRILFDRDHVRSPKVLADGPTESPHRFADASLCMWYPRDSDDMRWTVSDGLVALIGYAILHLFREAWWRETGAKASGEWLGDEAPHGQGLAKPVPREEARVGHGDY